MLGHVAILALSISACGCKKEAPESVSPGTAPASDADGASIDAKTAADLADMNKLVRAYVQSTKVIPKTVEELVTSGFVARLPDPPPGKAFAIRLHPFGYQVVLVDM